MKIWLVLGEDDLWENELRTTNYYSISKWLIQTAVIKDPLDEYKFSDEKYVQKRICLEGLHREGEQNQVLFSLINTLSFMKRSYET